MENTKKDALVGIIEKLEEYDLNPEEVTKIEFEDGKLVVWGEGWCLDGDFLLKKPDLSDPKVANAIENRREILNKRAKKILEREKE